MSLSKKERLEDLIDHNLIDNEELLKRKVPEGIGYLLNGNMCFGIFGKHLVLRVPPSRALKLIKQPHFQRFPSEDDPSFAWVMAAPPVYKERARLSDLLEKAIEFTASLPPAE